MATTQFTYDQVKNGFNGLIDYLQNPLRVYGAAGRGFWTGKITGTESKMLAVNANGLFQVSVDGGAFSSASNASGVHTLFTGLADIEHDVVVMVGPTSGTKYGYWVIDQSYLLEATGATPAASTLGYQWSAHSANLVSSGVTIAVDPTTYTPQLERNTNSYKAATSKVMFSTAASELIIKLGRDAESNSSLYYNVDGGNPIVVARNDAGTFKVTGLSGTHTYNIRAGSADGSSSRYSDIVSVMSDAPLVKVGLRLDQFGDSITHGAGSASNPIIDIHNTAAHFGRLGQTYAVSGWTVNDLLVNLSTFNLENLVESGDIAIMAIGRNSLTINTDPTIQADYALTITALLAAGYSKVFCRGILSESGDAFTAQNLAISNVVNDYANPNVFFVDVADWLSINTQDGVHPSQTGYAEMVEYSKTTYPKYFSPPTAYAGLDKTGIEAGEVVTITGTATAGTGTIASTVWTQTDGAVNLAASGNETLSLSATTPPIIQTTTFKLTVTNSNGVSSFDTMTLQNLASITPDTYSIVFSGTKDTVIKGYGNKVVFNFDFNVSQYLEMKISLGDETYSTVTNPLNLYVRNSSELVLDIGKVTEIGVGAIIPKIEADEILLNGNCKRVLKKDFNVC
jgi:lysophospholipase L1-like esterase